MMPKYMHGPTASRSNACGRPMRGAPSGAMPPPPPLLLLLLLFVAADTAAAAAAAAATASVREHGALPAKKPP